MCFLHSIEDILLLLLLLVLRCIALFLSLSLSLFLLFNVLGLLLLVLHALQSVKVLSIEFVQLTLDPLNSTINLWDNDKLKSIYSTVCNLNNSLNCNVLGLK